jgi:hypothetical protein
MGLVTALNGPLGILPPHVVDAVQSCLGDIAAEMADEILHAVPEYSRTSDGTYAATARKASELTVRDFVDRITDGAFNGSSVSEVFREVGRVEAGMGRDLGALQTAMHVGARVMWRRLSERLLELDVPAGTVRTVADSLFSHFAANASAAAEGHAQGRIRLAGEMQLHQHRLLDLLLAEPPPSAEAVADLARPAQWRTPKTVAVVVVPGLDTLEVPPDVLPGLHRSEPCLVVPDPDERGRLHDVERALRGHPGAVGPSVPLTDAAKSLRWALETLALRRRGLLDGSGLIRTADHLSTLLIFQNEDLLAALTRIRLAPLEQVRPGQRERLAETLLAWLQTAHDANAAAARLFVHPQTVRYRIRRLEELFGDRLYDPDTRLELELALRARRLIAESHPTDPDPACP